MFLRYFFLPLLLVTTITSAEELVSCSFTSGLQAVLPQNSSSYTEQAVLSWMLTRATINQHLKDTKAFFYKCPWFSSVTVLVLWFLHQDFGSWKGEDGNKWVECSVLFCFSFPCWLICFPLFLEISHVCLKPLYACKNSYSRIKSTPCFKEGKNSTGT